MSATIYQRRIVIGAVLCAAAFSLVGVRLVDVTLFKSAYVGVTALDRPATARADIVDRNGELLARDLPVVDLYLRPHALDDPRGAAQALARVTGANERRLIDGFNNAAELVLEAIANYDPVAAEELHQRVQANTKQPQFDIPRPTEEGATS